VEEASKMMAGMNLGGGQEESKVGETKREEPTYKWSSGICIKNDQCGAELNAEDKKIAEGTLMYATFAAQEAYTY
tara:strand:- start:445 stop:669 length:225 start_codon:yes stop_codon:yes gene_type:complete